MPRGVRLDPKHDKRTRAKIKTSQIINRLMGHVKGENEMTNTQIRAAEILLKKSLPDLHSLDTEIDALNQGPIVITMKVVDAKMGELAKKDQLEPPEKT